MSPSASPGSANPGAGVRALNRIPIYIVGGVLALFILMVVWVAVEKAKDQRARTLAQEAPRDSSVFADEIVGDRTGIIPPLEVPEEEVLIAPPPPDANLDKLPPPPELAAPDPLPAPAPVDPDIERFRLARMQMLENAAKAKTAIQTVGLRDAGSGSSGGGGGTPKTKEEMLARLAEARRAAGDPTAAYQARLAQIRAMQGGTSGGESGEGEGSAGGSVSALTAAAGAGNSNRSFGQFAQAGSGNDRWRLDSTPEAPRTAYELRAGFMALVALVVLVVLGVVAINMLLLIISGWLLAYAGVFLLGFGGSRWTLEIAINYYKTVLSIALQLMTMMLIVGICNGMLQKFIDRAEVGNLIDMSVVLIMAVVLLMLSNKLPALIGGLVTGASTGGAGIGQFGAGAAMGAASMAMATVATGGAAAVAGLKGAAGIGAAIHAAFAGAGSGGSDSGGSDKKSSGDGGGGNSTPFAEAAGFGSSSGSSSSGSAGNKSAGSGESSKADVSDSSGSKGGDGGSKSAEGDGASGSDSSGGNSDGGSKGAGSDSGNKSGTSGSGGGKDEKPGALKNLWEGTKDVAKSSFKASIADTVGGKIATAIDARTKARNAEAATESASFDGNSLSGGSNSESNTDVAEEVSNFVEGKSFREVEDDDKA